MAEDRDESDKTEDPSHKRLEEALQRGDVVKSQEVNAWFAISAAALVTMIFAGGMVNSIALSLRGLIANAHSVPTDSGGLMGLVGTLELRVGAALAAPFAVLVLAAIAGNIIQHRLVWSAQPLTPKLSNISPAAGARRLFSKHALFNFAKGLIKLVLIGAIMIWLLWPERSRLDNLVTVDLASLIALLRSLTLNLLGTVVAALGLIAGLDYLFQYRQWFERQKMSVRELKEEFKQTEGDPAVKGKLRQIRQNRARKRMIAQVPTASVVITNPTHYAVALRYEHGMNAPVCVAKGADAVALKIREVAAAHRVPIVENPPLARALHASAEIDKEIKPEHYKAVAEVIGYVMRLRRGFMR